MRRNEHVIFAAAMQVQTSVRVEDRACPHLGIVGARLMRASETSRVQSAKRGSETLVARRGLRAYRFVEVRQVVAAA
jgi:hypothetical protein